MAKKFVCTTTEPIVETKAGKIRGFISDGTYTFHGIQYGEAKRFQMPTPVKPWDGVKDALSYGFVSPMLRRETAQGEIMVPHRYWPKDEQCLYLNVWSQSVDTKAKKPVMVWLHGGGFSDGSSIEQMAYDGENLSKFGDVVVVSLNHRLNIIGYLDLSPYSNKYWNSGNAGQADIVEALKWIHDNIDKFGGDPDNVTIFGQSGGGGKVTSLLQTPSADGLFHKAIVMSGIGDKLFDSDNNSRPLIDAMLKELGIEEQNIEELETIPYDRLAEAYLKVSPDIRKNGGYVGCSPIPNEFYLGDPFDIGFTDHARTIPLIAGTVIGEMGGFAPGIPDKYNLSEKQMMEILNQTFEKDVTEVAKTFKEVYPEKCLTDLIALDSFSRRATKKYIKQKAAESSVPAFNYLFTYEMPMDDGKPAWHCSDIPFFFHNNNIVLVGNKPGISDRLEQQMSESFINFAKNGVPSSTLLPEWKACTKDECVTMIFDEKCEIRINHDDKLYDQYMQVAINPFAHHNVTVLH
jgi:para-nitrobenzyl esterase